MALQFAHDPAFPLDSPDVGISSNVEGGLDITLTLRSDGDDAGYIKMWYQQPARTYFNSAFAQPLCPYAGTIGWQVQSTPGGSEPGGLPQLPKSQCITQNLHATASAPVQATVSWMPPDPSQSVAFFFQACNSADDPSTWHPASEPNAQHS